MTGNSTKEGEFDYLMYTCEIVQKVQVIRTAMDSK